MLTSSLRPRGLETCRTHFNKTETISTAFTVIVKTMNEFSWLQLVIETVTCRVNVLVALDTHMEGEHDKSHWDLFSFVGKLSLPFPITDCKSLFINTFPGHNEKSVLRTNIWKQVFFRLLHISPLSVHINQSQCTVNTITVSDCGSPSFSCWQWPQH